MLPEQLERILVQMGTTHGRREIRAELRALLAAPVCGTCGAAIRPDALTGTACDCSHKPVDPSPGLLQAASYHDAIVKSWEADRAEAQEAIDEYGVSQPGQREWDRLNLASTNAANHFDFANDMRRMAAGDKPLNCPQSFIDGLSADDAECLNSPLGKPLPVSATSALAHALVRGQVVGRVYHDPLPVRAYLNSCGQALPDGAPLYARTDDQNTLFIRVPSRRDPKYNETWPDVEGGPVFDGRTYCTDLFETLNRECIMLVENLPEGAVYE